MQKDKIIDLKNEAVRRGRHPTGSRMYIGEFEPRRDIVAFDATGTDGREVAAFSRWGEVNSSYIVDGSAPQAVKIRAIREIGVLRRARPARSNIFITYEERKSL
jgi:hypothetical protein